MAHIEKTLVNGVITEITQLDHSAEQVDDAVGRALPGGDIETQLSTKANGFRGNAQALGYTKLVDLKIDGAYFIYDGPSFLSDYPAFLSSKGLNYATLHIYNAADIYWGKILFAQNASRTLNGVAVWCGDAGWLDIATATPPQPLALPLAAGYAKADRYACEYSKAQDGTVLVHLAINHTSGTLPTGYYYAATLPLGYRPKGIVGREYSATDGIYVNPDGNIAYYLGAPRTILIDTLEFRAQ